MTPLQLNHVALHVADVEASSRFYTEVLMLAPMPRPAFSFPGAWFRIGPDQELHLIGGRNEPVFSGSGGTHFALLVADIAEWERRFDALQIGYLPRRTRPDGAWQIYVSDPDGHTVELCQVPGTG